MPLDTALPNRLETAEPVPFRCGSVWAVAQTHPQAERWASANLTRQGYVHYLPLIRVRRRDPVIRSQYRTLDVPLFPGYLFVVPGTHWAPVCHTRGVARLLMADGRPQLLRAGLVETIQAGEQQRRTIAPPDAQWRPGAPCRVCQGPFAGHDAVVMAVDPIRIALMMFGEMREVDALVEWIEAR